MKRRSFLLLAVCLMVCMSSVSFAQTKTHRVLFALLSSDEADWRITIGNINNLIKGLAPDDVEVEVVAYAQGLSLVKNGSSMAKEVAELQEKHVKFVACQNAMRMQHVEAKDLLPGVGMVPAGIVEVVTKQEQGWTYIKAGR